MNPRIPLISKALAVASVSMMAGCATISEASNQLMHREPQYEVVSTQRGQASWYSVRTNRGTRTASGERLRDDSATAAHRSLPMGTRVRVINELNGRSEIVRINNRGPFIRGRIIDVTIGTAERLGFRQRGVAPVRVEVLRKEEGQS